MRTQTKEELKRKGLCPVINDEVRKLLDQIDEAAIKSLSKASVESRVRIVARPKGRAT